MLHSLPVVALRFQELVFAQVERLRLGGPQATAWLRESTATAMGTATVTAPPRTATLRRNIFGTLCLCCALPLVGTTRVTVSAPLFTRRAWSVANRDASQSGAARAAAGCGVAVARALAPTNRANRAARHSSDGHS